MTSLALPGRVLFLPTVAANAIAGRLISFEELQRSFEAGAL
jgi:hypothetical protein